MCPLHSILHSDVRENLSQHTITQASGIEYESQQDGSIDKRACCHAWQPEVNPRDPTLHAGHDTQDTTPQNHKQI